MEVYFNLVEERLEMDSLELTILSLLLNLLMQEFSLDLLTLPLQMHYLLLLTQNSTSKL